MKKDYLKPESNVVEISIDTIMQLTSNEHEGNMPGQEGEGNTDDFGAGRNRGEWGNIWGK